MKAKLFVILSGGIIGVCLILLGVNSVARAVGLDLRHPAHRWKPTVQPVSDPDELPVKHPHVVCAEPYSPDSFRGDLLSGHGAILGTDDAICVAPRRFEIDQFQGAI